MRISLTLLATVLPLLTAGLPMGTAQAAISPTVIRAVVANCPIKTNGVCADAVGDFLGLQEPGRARDTDIVKLVQQLAKAAKHPNITLPQCVELQKSILILGAAVQQSAPQQEIEQLAGELCGDEIVTGSIGKGNKGGNGGNGDDNQDPPVSLIEQSDDGGAPPPEDKTPPVQESGCVSDSLEPVACGS